MIPTVHRCSGCNSVFAVLPSEKRRKGTGALSCPVCQGKKLSAVDAVAEVGGGLARKVFNHLLTKLPSGD